MQKYISFYTKLIGLLLIVGFSASAMAAEDCYRGTLDKQYCDRDGNLTADLPTDPSKWVDPDSLIFAYTPVEDPAVYKSVWAGFIDHMSKTTGKKVIYFSVQSNAAQLEA
ncbi:MAG: phosphate/phosphite/phosphonate ABC transporter substrate-binding protein, partial [Gammaproteobacteria bacterium]